MRAFEAIAGHEAMLAGRLLDYLRQRRGLRVIGPESSDRAARVPTVSFVASGVASRAIVDHTDGLRIGIRHGDFHSRRLVEHLGFGGADGVVRVSLAHYNTIDEVDRLIAGLDDVLP